MDTRNGDLYRFDELRDMAKEKLKKLRPHLKQVKVSPTPRQLGERKVRPHDTCLCGSGKTFKKCCMKRSR